MFRARDRGGKDSLQAKIRINFGEKEGSKLHFTSNFFENLKLIFSVSVGS